MKKLTTLVSLMLAATMLAGCGSSEDSSKRPSLLDEINNSDNGGAGASSSTLRREAGYEWVIDPVISAENIIAPDGSQINPDVVINNAYIRVAIIEQEGRYGFIDYSGNIMVRPEYTDYYIDYDGRMTLMRVTGEGTEYCAIDEHGYTSYEGVDRKVKDRYFYYDSEQQQSYYQNFGSSYAKQYNGGKLIAAQGITATETSKDKYNAEIVNEKIALVKNNEQLTDFEYDDAYLPIYLSAGKTGIALEKDGKWGYVNGKGEQIIDFICDVVPHASLASSFSASEGIHPYLFAGDYIAVSVNSRFGYYDKEGNVVVTPGEFEQARPVLNGLAWVRKDGKWGVIQIGDIDEKLIITTTTTTTTTTAATTSKWTGTWATTTTTPEETTAEPEETEETEKTKKTKKTKETESEPPAETEPPETTTTTPAETEPPETTPSETEPPAETTPAPAPEPSEEPAENE